MNKSTKDSLVVKGIVILFILLVLFISKLTSTPIIDAVPPSTEDATEIVYNTTSYLYNTSPVFTPEETYEYDFYEKTADELYNDWFYRSEETFTNYHYYIEDHTLYLDENVCTGKQDSEGFYIYEYQAGKKIADNVIFVDYNEYYQEPNAIYISDNYELYGTGIYENLHLENIRFARVYAEQLLVLTLDGEVLCRGLAHCIGTGDTLFYPQLTSVLTDAVFANLTHYGYYAITTDGSLYMWGENSLGQFGDGSLLKENSEFQPSTYFYKTPVKVADKIKMVWDTHPGHLASCDDETIGYLRTYFLTNDDELFVSGEYVGKEFRNFSYYGEMGPLDAPLSVNCTSTLHKILK